MEGGGEGGGEWNSREYGMVMGRRKVTKEKSYIIDMTANHAVPNSVQLKTMCTHCVCMLYKQLHVYNVMCVCLCVCTISSEELYEDTDFPEKELSALVASKVSQ